MVNLRKQRFALLMLSLVLVLVAGCAPQADSSTPPTVGVTGNGDAQRQPDQATVTLGVSYVDTNLSLAISKSNSTIDRIHSALLEQQVDAQDIRTTGYNVWPEDMYDQETGQPTGVRRFHVDSSVEVTVRQLDALGGLITAGLDAGANNIYGVNFIVSDPTGMVDEARSEAIQDARSRAEAMAQGFGVQLGKITSISESINGVPGPVYSAAVGKGDTGMGGGGVSVSPGQTTVTVQVYVTYEIVQ